MIPVNYKHIYLHPDIDKLLTVMSDVLKKPKTKIICDAVSSMAYDISLKLDKEDRYMITKAADKTIELLLKHNGDRKTVQCLTNRRNARMRWRKEEELCENKSKMNNN